MKNDKIIASFLAALMSLVTLVYPALATPLNQYPSFLGSNGKLQALVVVGSGAAASDVAGAIDLATRLVELSYTPINGNGGALINGVEKNTIDINNGTFPSVFPNNGVIQSFSFSGLTTGTFTWKGNTYNYHEDINTGNGSSTPIYFSHDFATNYINGTETMVVPPNVLMYEYVFDSTFACNDTDSGVGGCTNANPEYQTPVKVTLLGKTFEIVGVDVNSVTMLSGNVGSAYPTTGVMSPDGKYKVVSDVGNAGSSSSTPWADIIVEDASGNVVDKAPVNQGSTQQFPSEGITVQVLTVRVLPDGTSAGTQIVVGNIGATTIQYPQSCSIGGTGSSDYNFPGETNWCIQGTFATAGKITAGDKIQVVYKPTSTQYFKYTGSTITIPLPNNFASVGFEGYNYNTFATLTFKPFYPQSVFFAVSGGQTNSTSVPATTVSGIEVDSDTPGTLIDPNTGLGYSKVAYLFNTSAKGETVYPVMVGFWDSTNGRWGIDLNSPYYKSMTATQTFNFNTTLSYGGQATGKDTYTLDVVMAGPGAAAGQAVAGSSDLSLFPTFAIIPNSASSYYAVDMASGQQGILLNYVNTTSGLNAWSDTTNPQFRLYQTDSPEVKDTQSVQTSASGNIPTYEDIGQSSQDVVDNSGLIIRSPEAAPTNNVIIAVPSQQLMDKAYVGMAGAGTTTPSGVYKAVVPVTTPIAYLDTDVMQNGAVIAPYNAENFVTVGGPCINTVTAAALNLTYPACGSASGIASGTGLIKIVDNYPATGLETVVVAGYSASDTMTASTVLQQWDTLLTGISASAVTVTAATAAGITPVAGS